MKIKRLHIVAFNIPYPPDYGGVMDVYYKIRALSALGAEVILHAFEYGRNRSEELEKLCYRVYYYRRSTAFRFQLGMMPYIVSSRQSELLLERLSEDEYPVIFEGLHTCYYLSSPALKEKNKLVRMHNIEQDYYLSLALNSGKPVPRLYFLLESFRLRRFQNVLKHAGHIAAISEKDLQYLDRKFGRSFLLNAFHGNDQVSSQKGRGTFLLYHGNLSVSENFKAAAYLLDHVFGMTDFPVVIAGKKPSAEFRKKCAEFPHVILVPDPDSQEMKALIENAHAIVLHTFQETGVKLKLIDSLFRGRFCIVNSKMVSGTGLGKACLLAETGQEYLEQIKNILSKDFTSERIQERKLILTEFSNERAAALLLDRLFS